MNVYVYPLLLKPPRSILGMSKISKWQLAISQTYQSCYVYYIYNTQDICPRSWFVYNINIWFALYLMYTQTHKTCIFKIHLFMYSFIQANTHTIKFIMEDLYHQLTFCKKREIIVTNIIISLKISIMECKDILISLASIPFY